MQTNPFLTHSESQTGDFFEKSPIPPVPLLPPVKGGTPVLPKQPQQLETFAESDFKTLFCPLPRYILYPQSSFCELTLPEDIFSQSLKELMTRFLNKHGIDCAFIDLNNQKCLRFKVDNNANRFIKNPLFSGTIEIGEKDAAHEFAAHLLQRGTITTYPASRRFEILIPPRYLAFGNDMAAILWQNKIPCHKIQNPRTKLYSVSFGNSTKARQFIKTLPFARFKTEKQDYLTPEALMGLAQKQLVKI